MFNDVNNLSELEAYLLGFIYADGCITSKVNNRYYALSIALAEKDKDHLQFICDTFNFNLNKEYIIKYNKNTKSYKLSVCSIDIINKLINLGVCPNKTYQNNSFVFDNLQENMKIHFVRGFYDGDGSIFVGKDKKYRVGIVSLNNLLLDSICIYINKLLNNNFIKTKQEGKYTRILLSGNVKCKTFLDLLYNNSNYFLQRKFILYKKITIKIKSIHPNIHCNSKNKKWIPVYRNKTTGKRLYLGSFKTIKEAVDAYNLELSKNQDVLLEYKGEKQH